MTPAEVLAAAADKLDALVAESSDGPWEVGSHKDMLNPGGPTWFLDGIERWRGLTNNVNLGEDEGTARYIAAMDPLVGKALAEWLRVQSSIEILDPEQWARFADDTLDEPVRHVWGGDPNALEIARLIVGGETVG